jgi:hypothetical protein
VNFSTHDSFKITDFHPYTTSYICSPVGKAIFSWYVCLDPTCRHPRRHQRRAALCWWESCETELQVKNNDRITKTQSWYLSISHTRVFMSQSSGTWQHPFWYVGVNACKETADSIFYPEDRWMFLCCVAIDLPRTQRHTSENPDTDNIIIIPPANFRKWPSCNKDSPFISILPWTFHLCLDLFFHARDVHSNKTRCHLTSLVYNYTEAAWSLPASQSTTADSAKCILHTYE